LAVNLSPARGEALPLHSDPRRRLHKQATASAACSTAAA
jgi:hypothetical protein